MKFALTALSILALLLAACGDATAPEATPGTTPEAAPVATPEAAPEGAEGADAVIKTSMGDVYVDLFAEEAPKTVENFLGLAEGTKEWKDPESGLKVKRPFYDGLIFHRVIKDFMIQGGCPLGNGTGDPGYKFDDELDGKGLGLADALALTNGNPHKWLAPSLRSQRDFQFKIVRPLCDLMGITNDDELKAREAEIRVKLDAMTLQEAYELMGYEYAEGRSKHKPLRGVLAMANSGPNTNGSQFFINLKDTEWLTGKHTVFGKVVKGMDVVDKIGETKTGPNNKPAEDVKIISIRRLAK